MGTKIVGTLGQSQHQLTVSVQAAGVLAIGVGEIGIFIGDTARDRNLNETISGLKECVNALNEQDFPTSANNTYASKDPDAAPVFASGVSIAGAAETDVFAMYDDTFFAGPGSSEIFMAHFTRLIDRWLENSNTQ